MRFKAKAVNASACISLQRIVQTLARISKVKFCRLRLSPEKVCFSIQPDVAEDQVRVWSESKQDQLFSMYRIESLHENNEILLEVSIDLLLRAIKTTVSSQGVMFKLMKRDGLSYLSIVAGTISSSGLTRPISQDVPVRVFPHEHIALTQPPPLPMPDVNIYLPDMRTLRSIVDRMRAISSTLVVCASMQGELVLKSETSLVSVKCYFRDLENPPWREGAPAATPHMVEARVDIRAVAQFMAGYQFSAQNVLLSIAESKAVTLFVLHDEVALTYFIPALME